VFKTGLARTKPTKRQATLLLFELNIWSSLHTRARWVKKPAKKNRPAAALAGFVIILKKLAGLVPI